MTALYRALVVFIGFAVCIGIVMVTVISVLHRVKMREAQERIKQMHEEQIAEQQLLEAQLRQAQLEREQRAEQFLAIGPGTHE